MSIGGVCTARVFEAAGLASEAVPSKTLGVPFGKSLVFIPTVASQTGKEHKLR
jgi:hypothetical protein